MPVNQYKESLANDSECQAVVNRFRLLSLASICVLILAQVVARNLGISEETVKAHMKSILSKLGANDRTHAVTIAIKRGIMPL